MPPAVFIGSSIGVLGGSTFTFAIPSVARAGDTCVMIIAAESGLSSFEQDNPTNVDLDYADLLSNFGAHATWVLRRILTETDSASIAVQGDAPPAWALASMLVYRDLADAPIVGGSGSVIAASTNFVAPSRTITRYSDLFIGGAIVSSAATAVAPPAGTSERSEIQTGGRTLEVYDLLPEILGATGTKTATTGGAQSGGAFSVALSVNGIRGSGKVIRTTPAGGIGLPTEGV